MAHVKYIVNVEGAIFRDGKYLVIVRGQGESHAAGLLAFVGGTVDSMGAVTDVLEENLKREILEEVGIEVNDLNFVQANQFVLDDATLVINIIFLCRCGFDEPRIASPDEVEQVLWLSVDEIIAHPSAPIWLLDNLKQVEVIRSKNGW